MAFHPQFGQNGNRKIYLTLSNNQGQTELREYSLNANGTVNSDSMKLVLNITDYTLGSALHRAGWIGFGPDGYLYMTTGEGNQPAATQDPTSLIGKVLRLDVDGADAYPNDPNRNYAIPAIILFSSAAMVSKSSKEARFTLSVSAIHGGPASIPRDGCSSAMSGETVRGDQPSCRGRQLWLGAPLC